MAPPAKEFNAEMLSLLNAIASCAEFPLDSKKFAEAEGIARSDNATAKFKRILKNNGFAYEGKRVVRIDSEGSGDNTAVKTPVKKAATPRKPKTNGTPVQKKRKLGNDGEGDGEGTAISGEVKNEEVAGEIKDEEAAGGNDE